MIHNFMNNNYKLIKDLTFFKRIHIVCHLLPEF